MEITVRMKVSGGCTYSDAVDLAVKSVQLVPAKGERGDVSEMEVSGASIDGP